MKRAITFASFLGIVALVAASGALFPPGEWYDTLAKPPWTPPDWLFAPAWTLLYVLIAIAGARAWLRVPPAQRRKVFTPYFIQLFLNAGWSALFFGLHLPVVALVELVLILAAIGMTMNRFLPHDRSAGLLLLPYLAWVAFAGSLNGAIAWLN